MWVQSLGWDDLLVEEMATHSSISFLENSIDRRAWWATVHRVAKNLPAMQETQVRSLGRKDPPKRECQTTQVFLPGEFHGQSSLTGYSPRGCKELDMTGQVSTVQHVSKKDCYK